MKRHTCIICGRKRYERSMKKVLSNSWACADTKYSSNVFCYEHVDIKIAENIIQDLKKLKFLNIKHIVNVTPERTITLVKKGNV